MNALTPNPKTGFLESRGPSLTGFDSAKKERFLALALEMVNAQETFSILSLCDAVGICHQTFEAHRSCDPVFYDAWHEIIARVEDQLVSTMVVQGRKPGGFMDRIAWLRAHNPGKWNPDNKVQISVDNGLIKNLSSRLSTYIDADIVDKPIDNATTVDVAAMLPSSVK